MKFKSLCVCAVFAGFPSICSALEVYRLIQKNCAIETGLVINADQTNLGLLNITGQYVSLQRDQITAILVYNSVTNPLREIQLSDGLRQMLVNIHVDETGNPLFSGWAVRFVDDLVFFYGTDGKSYTLDIHKIITIESVSHELNPMIPLASSQEITFGYGRNFPECGIKAEKQRDETNLQPMRILSDQIKIEKWFLNFQRGFRRLERFKQRTLFYAKPRLYEDQSRIGAYRFLGRQGGEEEKPKELHSNIPIFFHWSGGKPYLYQHQSWVGAKPSDMVAQAEPVFAFSSDIKAHLFHGSFIIGLDNPVPGYPTIIFMAPQQREYISDATAKDTAVFTHFNYMAFSGIDYGKSSYSGGFYYPIFGIQTGGRDGTFREVLASTGSPAVRYRYTLPNFLFRGLYAYTNYQVDNPTEKELALYPSEWLLAGGDPKETFENVKAFTRRYVDDFSFRNHYFRFGFDWDITAEVRLGVDEIMLRGVYHETLHDAEDSTARTYRNRVDFNHNITSVYLRHELDGRVAVSLYLNHYDRSQQSRFLDNDDTSNEAKISLFAIFEFML